MQTHDLESFSLESKLTQDATSNLTSFGSDEKAIRSRSMYYLQQVASHMNQPQTQYALLDTKHTVLYATGEKKLFEEHSLNDPQTYRTVSYTHLDVYKRQPVIPVFNYEKDTLESALRYLKSIGVCEVNLLPYHTLGKVKYEKMGKPYTLSNKMLQKEDLMCYLEYARQLGMQANIGG